MKKVAWIKIGLPLFLGVALALSPRPWGVEGALRAARQAENAQRWEAAAYDLEQAAQAVPWRADLWEAAGRDAWLSGDASRAVRLLQRARQAGALSPQGWVYLGDAQHKDGQAAAALATWKQAAAQGPGSTELFARLVQAYDQQADVENALAILQRWDALTPGQAQVVYLLGLHEAILRPEEALQHLNRAAVLDASLEEPVRSMQTSLNLAGLEQDRAYQWLMVGRGLASIGNWELAGAAFQRAVAANPDYAEAWAYWGEANQQVGKEGWTALARAQKLKPDSPLVQALMALYLRRQGKPNAALMYLERIAEKEPANPVWQLELGNTLSGMGKLSEALPYYQRAADLQPKDARYWLALGEFCITYYVEMSAVGLPAIRQAVALNPTDPHALDVMGMFFLKTNDQISAERFLQRSVQAAPDYAPAHLHLGILDLQKGQISAAYQHLSRAVQLAPDTLTGQQAQRLLNQNFPVK